MDSTAFDVEITEQIQRLQDLNKQMTEISRNIGVLQEQGKALHMAALEVKGAVEALAKMKAKQNEKLAKSKTAGLLLPEGVKPVVDEPASAVGAAAPVAEAATPLEVQ